MCAPRRWPARLLEHFFPLAEPLSPSSVHWLLDHSTCECGHGHHLRPHARVGGKQALAASASLDGASHQGVEPGATFHISCTIVVLALRVSDLVVERVATPEWVVNKLWLPVLRSMEKAIKDSNQV